MTKGFIVIINAIFTVLLLTCLTYIMGYFALWCLDINIVYTFKHAVGVTIVLYYLGFFFRLFGDK